MPNLISQIAGKIASVFRSAAQTGSVKMWSTGSTEVYPDSNVETAIEKGFKTNTSVYSIIKKDAKKFGSIPRYVESKSQEGKAEMQSINGKLSDLLNRPNEYQGQDAFFTLVRAFYKVTGEAFIWLNRGQDPPMNNAEMLDDSMKKSPVLEMYVVPSQDMVCIPDPDNPWGVVGFFLKNKPDVKFRKSDIIHWKDINLDWDSITRSQLRGFSALVAGKKSLTQNNSATDAAVRMYQNSGAKGVLMNDMAGTPTQETQVKDVLDNKINNVQSKNAVVSLQGKWAYANLGLTSVDMELLEGLNVSKEDICNLLGMPYELFKSETTFANKEMAQKSWVINEIIPDCKQLDGELNRFLPMAFGTADVICSEFDDLHELQADKKAQVEWLSKIPISPNEFREEMGFEKSDDENADKIFIPSGYTPLDDAAGDGGEELLKEFYANGSANRSNGQKKVPQNG